MRVAIYSRVSTDDKNQDIETQLLPLREFVAAQDEWNCWQPAKVGHIWEPRDHGLDGGLVSSLMDLL